MPADRDERANGARLRLSPEVEALLAPARGPLERALPRLPPGPTLDVRLGEVDGFSRLDGDTLWLSEALAGPALHHPAEHTLVPPLDRWRRALACVLEGVSLRALIELTKTPATPDWRWIGASIAFADAAAPELSLATPDLALAMSTGDLGANPRAGAAVYRLRVARGEALLNVALELLVASPKPLSAERWLAWGEGVLSPNGPLALPVPVQRRPRLTPPHDLSPWSWAPLEVSSRRGGVLTLDGPGACTPTWVPGGVAARGWVGATHGPVRVSLSPGGPVGRWTLGSVLGFGQVMGARGVELHLNSSGRLELVLADSFVGPVEALSIAEQYGTSGTAMGRWRVTGPARLRFADIVPLGLTMHSQDGMAIPADASSQSWIQQLQAGDFAWSCEGEQLTLRGRMMDSEVTLRLKRT